MNNRFAAVIHFMRVFAPLPPYRINCWLKSHSFYCVNLSLRWFSQSMSECVFYNQYGTKVPWCHDVHIPFIRMSISKFQLSTKMFATITLSTFLIAQTMQESASFSWAPISRQFLFYVVICRLHWWWFSDIFRFSDLICLYLTNGECFRCVFECFFLRRTLSHWLCLLFVYRFHVDVFNLFERNGNSHAHANIHTHIAACRQNLLRSVKPPSSIFKSQT